MRIYRLKPKEPFTEVDVEGEILGVLGLGEDVAIVVKVPEGPEVAVSGSPLFVLDETYAGSLFYEIAARVVEAYGDRVTVCRVAQAGKDVLTGPSGVLVAPNDDVLLNKLVELSRTRRVFLVTADKKLYNRALAAGIKALYYPPASAGSKQELIEEIVRWIEKNAEAV